MNQTNGITFTFICTERVQKVCCRYRDNDTENYSELRFDWPTYNESSDFKEPKQHYSKLACSDYETVSAQRRKYIPCIKILAHATINVKPPEHLHTGEQGGGFRFDTPILLIGTFSFYPETSVNLVIVVLFDLPSVAFIFAFIRFRRKNIEQHRYTITVSQLRKSCLLQPSYHGVRQKNTRRAL